MKCIIHAGWNKTGTTYLQNRLFPTLDTLYLKGPVVKIEDIARMRIPPSQGSAENFPCLLISDERLISTPVFSPFESRHEARIQFIKNLQLIFKDVHFILCLRKQDSFIRSLYAQYINVGGSLAPERFFNDSHDSLFKLEDFTYLPTLKALTDSFKNQHFIYDFDDFRKNPKAVIEAMITFIMGPANTQTAAPPPALPENQKQNVSLTGSDLESLRRINRLYYKSPNNPRPLAATLLSLVFKGKTPRIWMHERVGKRKTAAKPAKHEAKYVPERYLAQLQSDWEAVQPYFRKF